MGVGHEDMRLCFASISPSLHCPPRALSIAKESWGNSDCMTGGFWWWVGVVMVVNEEGFVWGIWCGYHKSEPCMWYRNLRRRWLSSEEDGLEQLGRGVKGVRWYIEGECGKWILIVHYVYLCCLTSLVLCLCMIREILPESILLQTEAMRRESSEMWSSWPSMWAYSPADA